MRLAWERCYPGLKSVYRFSLMAFLPSKGKKAARRFFNGKGASQYVYIPEIPFSIGRPQLPLFPLDGRFYDVRDSYLIYCLFESIR